jgi:hypothetical protein
MKNFKNQALIKLKKIEDHLSENRLEQMIDSKVLHVIKDYPSPDYMKITNLNELLNYIGGFVQQIYRFGLNPSKTLSHHQAIAQGIYILEKTDDFDSLYMHVLDDPDKGIETIIQSLVATIINQARKNYVTGFLCQEIDPWDFELIFDMTKILLAELKPHFPLHMQNLPDTMFLKSLPVLILTKIQENGTVINLLSR